ncbi:MAG: competence protein ComE [Archangium gephyra]|uniref:Competence protein ComE n=1 Tax=Archangium gephyra TaxID=48 RepID=A0A2W5SWC7_9BACT|nr:MAG: competence protein ComE [Archangium gephyra]
MHRSRAIVIVVAMAAIVGAFAWWRPSAPAAPTRCPDGAPLRLGADGVATCGAGAPMPPAKSLTLRQKFDCNTATERELAMIPGVGPHVANELVKARGTGFTSWEQIDAVPGVGDQRLLTLQAACEIRLVDSGVW